MIKNLAIILLVISGGVYALNSAEGASKSDMNNKSTKDGRGTKTLIVKWQRLVDEKGRTCDRCGATEKELRKAFRALRRSLPPLGIKVILEKETLTPAECAKDVSQSNRIWLSGRPLEEWLNAEVGKSLCGFCCEDLGDEVECRTVEIDGQVYETIPKQLIVRAGLLAASQLLTPGANEPCCPKEASDGKHSSSCCPQRQSGPGCR